MQALLHMYVSLHTFTPSDLNKFDSSLIFVVQLREGGRGVAVGDWGCFMVSLK